MALWRPRLLRGCVLQWVPMPWTLTLAGLAKGFPKLSTNTSFESGYVTGSERWPV